mmetsp:Transcript_1337/g.3414  ORF Transcript_1337/g.3414 Transcript_1337/m.3414 type:complete len:124 (-) Transcript_1337:196-567(-)
MQDTKRLCCGAPAVCAERSNAMLCNAMLCNAILCNAMLSAKLGSVRFRSEPSRSRLSVDPEARRDETRRDETRRDQIPIFSLTVCVSHRTARQFHPSIHPSSTQRKEGSHSVAYRCVYTVAYR